MSIASSSLPDDLEQSIRRERKFSLGEAIGREGGSLLQDTAAIPRPLRAITAINVFLEQHLEDSGGALQPCIKRWIRADIRVSAHLDQPLEALRLILTDIVQQPHLLHELARQVAIEWGHICGERPRFQKIGAEPQADVAYCHADLRRCLEDLLGRL